MKESFIPIVVSSKIAEDAKAQSHRKEIRKIFNTKSNNLIGLDNSDDLLIKIGTKEELKQIKDNINVNERTVQIKIEELLANEEKHICIVLDAKNILETENIQISAYAKITANNMNEFISNTATNNLSKPILKVNQYSNL